MKNWELVDQMVFVDLEEESAEYVHHEYVYAHVRYPGAMRAVDVVDGTAKERNDNGVLDHYHWVDEVYVDSNGRRYKRDRSHWADDLMNVELDVRPFARSQGCTY